MNGMLTCLSILSRAAAWETCKWLKEQTYWC
jgi:hypothetical protein